MSSIVFAILTVFSFYSNGTKTIWRCSRVSATAELLITENHFQVHIRLAKGFSGFRSAFGFLNQNF